MASWIILALIVAAWVCVIAWLVRARAVRWIQALVVVTLAVLTAAWIVPRIQRAKHDAQLVEAERRAQEQELNAMLREARSRR